MEYNNNKQKSNNNNNLFNFNITELKSFSLKKVYIILKEYCDKGVDYIKNKYIYGGRSKNILTSKKKQLFNSEKIIFYYESKGIKNNDNLGKEFSIVTEEFLEILNIDKKIYENAFVNYFEVDNMHFLL